MKIAFVILLLLFTLPPLGECQSTPSSPTELHFNAEDPAPQNPVKIPADVWDTLLRDQTIKDVMEGQNSGQKEPPASWFAPYDARLHGSQNSDLIVVGKGPLQGANVTTFWVFLSTSKGLKLVLSVSAHDLIVKNTQHNGFRTIETLAATANRSVRSVYRFNGKNYVRY